MNVEETARKAMARPVRSRQRRQGARFMFPSLAEMEAYLRDYEPWQLDEPRDRDGESAGEWQDRRADQVDAGEFDPDDRWDRPHVPDWDGSL